MKKSLDIFGPYPPPYGGISIHIFRIARLLKENDIDYKIYNHDFTSGNNIVATKKSFFWYLKYFFQEKPALIHFHQFFAFHYPYLFFLSHFYRGKIILTIHEEKILGQHPIVRRFLLFFIKYSKLFALISVSKKLSDYLNIEGIRNRLLPAYVPPPWNASEKFELAGNKEYFLFSIWKLEKTIATKVYNIDLAFKFLSTVKHRYKMLFLIGSKDINSQKYLNELVVKYDVEEAVTIFYEKQLVDYLPSCKFLLRTNNEDGYGVSLQEALDLRIPALATNVCVRPRGTILFNKDDLHDLAHKVSNIELLWNPEIIESPSYHTELIEMYKTILR